MNSEKRIWLTAAFAAHGSESGRFVFMRKFLLVSMMILAVVLTPTPAAAQTATPEGDQLVPTPTPIFIDFIDPLATATATPTATMTPTPTSTATPTLTPTATSTATPAAAVHRVDLPSGNVAYVEMRLTAGDVMSTIATAALTAVFLFDLLRRMARGGSL